MSMRNFLRNPKIALRKPTEHPKYSKNQKILGNVTDNPEDTTDFVFRSQTSSGAKNP